MLSHEIAMQIRDVFLLARGKFELMIGGTHDP